MESAIKLKPCIIPLCAESLQALNGGSPLLNFCQLLICTHKPTHNLSQSLLLSLCLCLCPASSLLNNELWGGQLTKLFGQSPLSFKLVLSCSHNRRIRQWQKCWCIRGIIWSRLVVDLDFFCMLSSWCFNLIEDINYWSQGSQGTSWHTHALF